ncbi:Alpha/Beta hydrolase protein [Piptocephalis cylindrospora]|uniref:Alpha/Beta hydrolase protein n=1 Tax=Piptocephalis cylindrospora TaxID=1907219 RepID=A0A4V1IY37_9FUNG|nr:Alpha/Beta hydrolase protein [Piptocephalis cylindrospora]|eukprot:RKP13199.1 Alpha/Beta hydrolase protein [Piptocephalis cylindrospora]
MEAYFESTTTYVPASTAPFKLATSIHRTIGKGAQDKSDGPTLLFAHANGYFKEIWFPVMLRLARAGFHGTCIAYDMRNHGDSGLVNNPIQHQLEGYVVKCNHTNDDAQAVIRGLDLKGPIIGIGHSMGGMALLRTELAHPGTFERIIALDPTVYVNTDGIKTEDQIVHGFIAFAMKRRSHWPSRNAAWEDLRQHFYHVNWHPEMLATFVQHGLIRDPVRGGFMLKSTLEEECNIYRGNNLQATRTGRDVSQLNLPVTYICGRKSRMIPMVMAVQTAMKTKGSEFIVMSKGTHMILMEEVDRISVEITRILKEDRRPKVAVTTPVLSHL